MLMKRFLPSIFLLIVLSCLSTAKGLAQVQPEAFRPSSLPKEAPAPVLKSSEELLFHEDFATGLPAGWMSVDEADYCGFKYTTQGPQGPLSVGMPALKSLTASNGFMILDSDLCAVQKPGQTSNAYLQTHAFDLSDNPSVMLRFQHNFRYCCSSQSMLAVEVSTDGQQWTVFDVRNGVGPNNVSPNAVIQNVDISDVAGGKATVWIRFRKSGASHYWWMIDDVMLLSFLANDLELKEANYGGYTRIPGGQQQDITFSGNVFNAGGRAQTQVQLNIDVNAGFFQSSSAPLAVLAVGKDALLKARDPFLPQGKGVYQMKFTAKQAETEQIPENNTLQLELHITDTVYARDANYYDPEYKLSLKQDMALGNTFSIQKLIRATSVSFALHEHTKPATVVQALIYKKTTTGFEVLKESLPYVIQAGDLPAGGQNVPAFIHLGFSEPLLLSAGEYLAAVVSQSPDQDIALAAWKGLGSTTGFSFEESPQGWQELTWIPLIRMNFGENIADCDNRFHFEVQDAECGTPTGSIMITPLSGTAPFQFQWEAFPGDNSPFIGNLAAGTWKVIITDAQGCISEHEILVESTDLKLEFESEDARCGGANGTARVKVLNGTGPFAYSWDFDSNLNSDVATALLPGKYTVNVIDAGGCKGVIELEVKNDNLIPVDILVEPAICTSASGSISLTPLAGEGPFVYTWKDFADHGLAQASDLVSGKYVVTVSDQSGCESVLEIEVSQQEYTLEMDFQVKDATCGLNNGTAEVGLLNGVSPFVFNWSNGLSGEKISQIPAGSYTLMVADAYGCRSKKNFEIKNTGEMPKVTTSMTPSPGCGQSQGALKVEPGNGATDLTYIWYAQDAEESQVAVFEKLGLSAGVYKVGVRNTEGCELLLHLNVTDNDGPSITGNVTDISCFGKSDGVITVSLQNAGSGATYLWNNAAESTTSRIDNLLPGFYSVIVKDGNCQVSRTFEVKQPNPLYGEAIISHNVCFDDPNGSIQIAIKGGRAPFATVWGDQVQGTLRSNVVSGTYTLTITDLNLCRFTGQYTVEAQSHLKVNSEVTQTTEGQNNGAIKLDVTGGVGPLAYVWSHGANSALIENLAIGAYSVTVSDGVNCSVQKSFMIGTLQAAAPLAVPQSLQVFPNPVKDLLYLSFQPGCVEAMQIQVFNLMGKLVFQEVWNTFNSGDKPQIDLSALPQGVYVVRVACGNHIMQSKFIKQ